MTRKIWHGQDSSESKWMDRIISRQPGLECIQCPVTAAVCCADRFPKGRARVHLSACYPKVSAFHADWKSLLLFSSLLSVLFYIYACLNVFLWLSWLLYVTFVCSAMVLESDVDDEGREIPLKWYHYLLHFFSFLWKVIFAFVPPR